MVLASLPVISVWDLQCAQHMTDYQFSCFKDAKVCIFLTDLLKYFLKTQ